LSIAVRFSAPAQDASTAWPMLTDMTRAVAMTGTLTGGPAAVEFFACCGTGKAQATARPG
jgi:chemotaxis response regulator CheB